jgi:3-oxoacyl-[acyl-carrier-protein] synthase III
VIPRTAHPPDTTGGKPVLAVIRSIEYHLPATTVTNQQLAAVFPEWSAEAILAKTGIGQRQVAAPDECASDLAVAAARKLFTSGACAPDDVDFLLFCTQCPDYIVPATACLLQDRLGLPTRAGALDFTLGCSGYVYGLSLAKGLVETGQARNVLFLTADTMTKRLHPKDRGMHTLLGDGAAATLIQARREPPPNRRPWIGPFMFGTDGKGSEHLNVRGGAMRRQAKDASADNAEWPSLDHVYMNGPEVYTFTLQVVPQAVTELLMRSELTLDEVDLFVFHQANGYMLEAIRHKLKIPTDRFVISMRDTGNTAASSIPIALKDACVRGQLRPGLRVMLVSFGAGYSLSATLIHWPS